MNRRTFIEEMLDKLNEITTELSEWHDDTFFLALEYAQQLQDELQTLADE